MFQILFAVTPSSNKKVILVGADLRNQIHNYLNVNKNDHKGISDIIYNKFKLKDVYKSDNLDIIFQVNSSILMN